MATNTGYQDYSSRTSVTGSLQQAATDTPLLGTGIKFTQDAAKLDIGALGADIGNFVMGAGATLADPLNALISAGLSFLMDVIQPLRDCLEKVTGDSGALDDTKTQFSGIGKQIDGLADDLDDITGTGFQNWTGVAKDAAAQQVESFVQTMRSTADNAGYVADVLGLSAMLMEGAYNIVLGIISDCIEWLIVTWVAALAAEVPTLGASTAAAGAATAGEVAVESGNAAEKVEQATSFVERIEQILQKLMNELKTLEKNAAEAEKAASEGEKAAAKGEKAATEGEKTTAEGEKAASEGSRKSNAEQAKENWQKQFDEQKGEEGKTLRRYLLDPEPGKDGSTGMNRIQDVLLDPLREDGIKLSGYLIDHATTVPDGPIDPVDPMDPNSSGSPDDPNARFPDSPDTSGLPDGSGPSGIPG